MIRPGDWLFKIQTAFFFKKKERTLRVRNLILKSPRKRDGPPHFLAGPFPNRSRFCPSSRTLVAIFFYPLRPFLVKFCEDDDDDDDVCRELSTSSDPPRPWHVISENFGCTTGWRVVRQRHLHVLVECYFNGPRRVKISAHPLVVVCRSVYFSILTLRYACSRLKPRKPTPTIPATARALALTLLSLETGWMGPLVVNALKKIDDHEENIVWDPLFRITGPKNVILKSWGNVEVPRGCLQPDWLNFPLVFQLVGCVSPLYPIICQSFHF